MKVKTDKNNVSCYFSKINTKTIPYALSTSLLDYSHEHSKCSVHHSL